MSPSAWAGLVLLVAGVIGFVLFARYNSRHNTGGGPQRTYTDNSDPADKVSR